MPGAPRSSLDRIARLAALLLVVAMPLGPRLADAQLPSLPVLQNAWANGGATAGLNVGGAGGSGGAIAYAIAGAWAPSSMRFQLVGGLGVLDVDSGATWAAYGARVAVPILSAAAGTMGVAAFAGVGGARRDSVSVVRVPIGVGLGYRRAVGATRGISAYVTPFFLWSRASLGGEAADRESAFRASIGVDVGLARSIGVTVGYEFGSGSAGTVGGGDSIFGAGLSYAFR